MKQSVVAAALAASALLAAMPAGAAESFKAACHVSTGAHGGRSFAQMKCRRTDRLGFGEIRGLYWADKDAEDYKSMARLAGRRFTCTFTHTSTNEQGEMIYTNYTPSDCR